MKNYDVFVSWSGGKDSSYALYLNLLQGYNVYARCFIPMYDAHIPLIRKNHYEFILSTVVYFQSLGCDVDIVYGDQTYKEWCLSLITRGPNKGLVRGFPSFMPRQCGFKHVKVSALQKNLPPFVWADIGIAIDETDRQSQLNDYKRSILCEQSITELDCFLRCRSLGLLSPIYNDGFRDGCALCGNSTAKQRMLWYRDYDCFDDVFEFQELLRSLRPGQSPLRNNSFWIDPFQCSIFD